MNTVITSKDAILKASRELIQTRGWESVTIRNVANACHISIGSVYNYFSSKSDLISAAIESVWCDIFQFPESNTSFDSFLQCIAWIFDSIQRGNEKYPNFFTMHSISFVGKDKSNGEKLMEKSWQHIQDNLYLVLSKDKNIRADIFDENFTPQKLVEIIFSLIISALLQQNYDCSAILAMLSRILYENSPMR